MGVSDIAQVGRKRLISLPLNKAYSDLLLGYHYDFETLIMSNYRRLTIRGETYFFTVVAYRR
jgi:hypothetical protein